LTQIITSSERETELAGKTLASHLGPGDTVALFGELGAGKTAFIRGMAEGLGVKDAVSSPSFAILHEYRGEIPLYHFDMYRVSGWDDLCFTGFFDYLGAGGVCAVEWSENIDGALPENAVRVHMERREENERIIKISGSKEDVI